MSFDLIQTFPYSVPPAAPVHFYELGGAGTLFAKKSEVQNQNAQIFSWLIFSILVTRGQHRVTPAAGAGGDTGLCAAETCAGPAQGRTHC